MMIIVDTYEDFKPFKARILEAEIEERIKLWLKYMSNYPELLKLQVECYQNDWMKYAYRVLSKVHLYLEEVEEAWNKLHKVSRKAYQRFSNFLNTEVDVVFVFYVGIGCGAGWATQYENKYAVLLGLENIVEEGWTSEEDLLGLIFHELGHIAHMFLRNISPKAFEELESNPLFLLYSEGFAMRIEHLLLGKEKWRIASHPEWLKWCKENMAFLAKEYLKRAKRGEPVNEFYGSWLNIKGYSQTGYYLGHEFIKELEKELTLKEIAKLPLKTIEGKALKFLSTIY